MMSHVVLPVTISIATIGFVNHDKHHKCVLGHVVVLVTITTNILNEFWVM